MFKKDFFDWMEQQSNKHMGPNKLLKEFEEKFGQFLLFEKYLLEMKKSELFVLVINEVLKNRLLLVF